MSNSLLWLPVVLVAEIALTLALLWIVSAMQQAIRWLWRRAQRDMAALTNATEKRGWM